MVESLLFLLRHHIHLPVDLDSSPGAFSVVEIRTLGEHMQFWCIYGTRVCLQWVVNWVRPLSDVIGLRLVEMVRTEPNSCVSCPEPQSLILPESWSRNQDKSLPWHTSALKSISKDTRTPEALLLPQSLELPLQGGEQRCVGWRCE